MTIKFDIASTYDEKISEFELGDINYSAIGIYYNKQKGQSPLSKFYAFPYTD